MTIIANKCSDYKITVVDISKERIAAWNSNELPIFEPGLKDRLVKVRGKNLFFSNDIDTSIHQADIIFVCVNTPIKKFPNRFHFLCKTKTCNLEQRIIQHNKKFRG